VRRLLVTASVIPNSPIRVTMMKEELSSSETSVLTRATRRNNPEDTIINVSIFVRRNHLFIFIPGEVKRSVSYHGTFDANINTVYYEHRRCQSSNLSWKFNLDFGK
jgi:hypothetical protein